MYEIQFSVSSVYKGMEHSKSGKKNRKEAWHFEGIALNMENSFGQKMNRLAVYSYLTRYPYGHTRSDRLFTVPLLDTKIPDKMRCWTRQKKTDNYQMFVFPVHRTVARQLYCESEKLSPSQLGFGPDTSG